jgi:glycosyltransferase involved in cell wall biosynthesis
LAGAERAAFYIVAGLDKRRYEPILGSIVSPQSAEQKAGLRTIEEAGIRTLDLGKVPRRKSVMAVARLTRFLRQHSIDIIHTQCSSPDTYGRLAAVLAGVPIRVVTLQNIVAWQNHPHLGLLLERILARQTTRFVAVSKTVQRWAQEYLKIDQGRIDVIYNGADPKRFKALQVDRGTVLAELGLDPTSFVLLTVGRLSEQKGQSFLIEAGARLVSRGHKIQLLLAGDGPDRSSLEAAARSLGVPTHFLGWCDDVERLYQVADIFVLPSLWEGLPLALLEAMVSGVPVVATEVSAMPEVVQHEVNGILVPPGDVDALAAAVERLIVDGQLRNKLGRAALVTAEERFAVDQMVRAYEALYDQLVGAHR